MPATRLNPRTVSAFFSNLGGRLSPSVAVAGVNTTSPLDSRGAGSSASETKDGTIQVAWSDILRNSSQAFLRSQVAVGSSTIQACSRESGCSATSLTFSPLTAQASRISLRPATQ